MSFRRLVKLYDSPCVSGLNMLSEDQNDAINANLVNEIKANGDESLLKQNENSESIKVIHRIDVLENNSLAEPCFSSNVDGAELDKSKTTVFVGNISFSASRKELKNVLSKFGKIRHIILNKRHKNRNLSGYGFVTFSKISEADAAIQASEPIILSERPLRICLANKKRTFGLIGKKKKNKNKNDEFWPDKVLEDGDTKTLHDDDLLLIFSHLSVKDLLAVRNVCIRWKYLVGKHLSSIKKFPYRDTPTLFQDNFTSDAFHIIIGYCSHILTELNMSSHGYIVGNQTIAIISNSCPNLVNINFSNSDINNHDLKSLASKCKKIKIATLSRCTQFGEKGLWWFLHLLPDLTFLDITFNFRLTGKCFNKMGPNLQSLLFNGNQKLSDYGFSSIAFKCKSLSELQLINLMSLKDANFINICQNCVTLKKLTVKQANFTSSGFISIAQLPFLEELDISHNQHLDSAAVIQIAKNCQNLRIVNISGPSDICDIGVEEFARSKKLVDLDLGYIQKVKDESLIKIAKSGTLRRLCLRGCGSITDTSCVEILNCCPNLEYLDLSSCIFITSSLLDFFLYAVQARNNKLCLTVILGGTCIAKENVHVSHPLLKLEFFNYCNRRYLSTQWEDEFYFSSDDEYNDYASDDYESDNWDDGAVVYGDDDYWDFGYE